MKKSNYTKLLNELNDLYNNSKDLKEKSFKCTLEHVQASLMHELHEPTTKKDKIYNINTMLLILEHFKKLNLLKTPVLFERTNTTRKNTKTLNALHINNGVLIEMLVNIALDYYINKNIKDLYYKQPAGTADTIINGVSYEIKLVSRYATSTPKNNDINNIITILIDGVDVKIVEITTANAKYHKTKETVKHKNGTTSTKDRITLALYQPNGIDRNDILKMLGL